jgi:hypothetical protein
VVEIQMVKGPDKPTLAVINPASSGIEPPRKLGEHGMALWAAVQSEYRIDDVGGIELLAQACAAVDRIEALAEAIDRDGETLRTKTGVKAHPALRDELARPGLCLSDFGPAGGDDRERQAHRPTAGAVEGLMPTNRTPIERQRRSRFTPEILPLFARLDHVPLNRRDTAEFKAGDKRLMYALGKTDEFWTMNSVLCREKKPSTNPPYIAFEHWHTCRRLRNELLAAIGGSQEKGLAKVS